MGRFLAERVVRVRSLNELPEYLEPGVKYDFGEIVFEPVERLSKEEAESIIRGLLEMVKKL